MEKNNKEPNVYLWKEIIMNRFATGFIIGNIVGMTSILLKDKNPKKTLQKTTKNAISKVSEIVDDIVDMYR